MMMWQNGWLWLIAALVLAGAELMLPGWVFLGVAAAVGLMGLALLAGIWGGSLPMALVVTAALSGVIWWLLRRAMGVPRGQVKIWDRDIND